MSVIAYLQAASKTGWDLAWAPRLPERLQALGYAEVTTRASSLLGPAGVRFRGHQFRYSELVGVPETVPRVYAVARRPLR